MKSLTLIFFLGLAALVFSSVESRHHGDHGIPCDRLPFIPPGLRHLCQNTTVGPSNTTTVQPSTGNTTSSPAA
ncbi:hypothetical protein V5799_006585 [Amblyomma americanum]|uniref:Secreted protein n=1 Tax=Amblyomma americanum TaxID=6943 RepID=A0AAQ4DVZ9_AMBAM